MSDQDRDIQSCNGCIHIGELRCIHGVTYFCRNINAPRRTPADDSTAAKLHAYFGVTANDPRLLPASKERPDWCPGHEAAPSDLFCAMPGRELIIDMPRCIRATFVNSESFTPEQRALAEEMITGGPPKTVYVHIRLPDGASTNATGLTVMRHGVSVTIKPPPDRRLIGWEAPETPRS